MRFVSLEVESFRAVRRAQISFGPGLTVVFGPNDVGKSTLAAAVEAALLVPPSSAEAASYVPWYADATPRVTLVFTDDQNRYWKISKAFGDEQTAELSASKDGRAFRLDSKARAVDGKVRELLGWGIPAPGGKGAPRGLPVSFLSQVLLAPQTDVEGILGQSIADDASNTGQLRLNKALATLAQDPLFKSVLDQAQAEVEKLFTPTGRIKKSSELAAASEAIKKVQADLAQVERDLESSQSVEAEVNRLREEHGHALQRLSELQAVHDDLLRRLKALGIREAVQARVDAAQGEVGRIDIAATEVKRLGVEVARLEGEAKARELELSRAQQRKVAAEQSLREAEDKLRAAQSEDGARQRALQKAQLEAKAAGLREQLQQARARQEKAGAALTASEAARQAQEAAREAERRMAEARTALAVAEGKLPAAEQEVTFNHALQAYGRWRVEVTRAAEARQAAEAAQSKSAEAAAKAQQAAALARTVEEKRARLMARQALLPQEATLRALVELDRKLAVAEAALGGGLSVAVHAHGQSVVKAAIDGATTAAELRADAVLEAQRTVKLSVGTTVEIEVTAGSPESRKAVERLRAEWQARGAPALERAGIDSLAALSRLSQEAAHESQALAVQAKELERVQGDAANLAEQVRQLTQKGSVVEPDAEELARMRGLFGAAEEHAFAAAFSRLGKNWEAQVEGLITSAARRLQAAQEELSNARNIAQLAEYKAGEATKLWDTAEAQAKTLISGVGVGDLSSLLGEAKRACALLVRAEQETAAELQRHEEGTNGELAQAQRAVEGRAAEVVEAEAAVASAGNVLEAARAAFHSRAGEHAQARAQLAQLDRPAAEVALAACKAELAALPSVAPVTDADLSAADVALAGQERAVEQVKQQLHTAEGALSKVGGAALADAAGRLREALETARAREKELQIDGEAWKLLQEMLRAVENEEGAHLGRALAGPIAVRFGELTGGRYDGLRLDTSLKAEGLSAAGANSGTADVIQALSVGTRDQLATLLRLTIADQLKTAILLDDQLVHTDATRQKWFVDVLLKMTLESQVIVLTCQPEAYLDPGDLSRNAESIWDVAAGRVRLVDASRVIERFGASPNQVRTSGLDAREVP